MKYDLAKLMKQRLDEIRKISSRFSDEANEPLEQDADFEKYLKGKVNLRLCKTLNNAVISIFKDTKNVTHKKIIILLSPASASYDQFKNFEDRGNRFKKLIKNYF